MFLLFFMLYIYCDCYRVEPRNVPNFNEDQLTDRVHQSLVDVDRFLENVQNKIRNDKFAQKNALRQDGVQQKNYREITIKNYEVKSKILIETFTRRTVSKYSGSLSTDKHKSISNSISKILRNVISSTTKITLSNSLLTTPLGHLAYSPTSPQPYNRDAVTSTYLDGRSSDLGTYLSPYPSSNPNPVNYLFLHFLSTSPSYLPPKDKSESYGDNELRTLRSPTDEVELYSNQKIDFKDVVNDPVLNEPSILERPPLSPEAFNYPPSFIDVNILRTFHPNLTLYLQQKFLKNMNISARENYQWLFAPPSSEILKMNGTVSGFTTNKLAHLRLVPTTRKFFSPPTLQVTGSQPVTETTSTVQHGKILIEDKQGQVYLETIPPNIGDRKITILPDGRTIVVPAHVDLDWATPSTAGDVLQGKIMVTTQSSTEIFKEELYAEMDRERVGYMHVFLVRLFYLVASKKQDDVRSVLRHVQPIMFKMFNDRLLASWGQPLLRITMSMAIAVSEGETDVIQSYAGMLYFMLKNRKETAAADINAIIENYESMFRLSEGEDLFKTLKEFDDYPNITMTPFELCNSLLRAFLKPLQRLSHSQRRQDLIDSINYALSTRFPRRRRDGDSGELLYEQALPYKTLPLHDAEVRTLTEANRRRNIRKLQYNHYTDVTYDKKSRRKSIIKKTSYGRENQRKKTHSDFIYERILHRHAHSVLPDRDGNQRKVQRTTRKHKILNIISSTVSHHFPIKIHQGEPYVKSRSTKDYKPERINNKVLNNRTYKNLNENIVNLLKEKIGNFYRKSALKSLDMKDDPPSEKESVANNLGSDYKTKDRRGKFKEQKKVNMLRKIVDDSSYSDEEEALRVNLISALIHGNRTFEMKIINETTIHKPMTAISGANNTKIGYRRKKDSFKSKKFIKKYISTIEPEVVWKTGYDDATSEEDKDSSM